MILCIIQLLSTALQALYKAKENKGEKTEKQEN